EIHGRRLNVRGLPTATSPTLSPRSALDLTAPPASPPRGRPTREARKGAACHDGVVTAIYRWHGAGREDQRERLDAQGRRDYLPHTLSVACPSCGARPGVACRPEGGEIHQTRLRASAEEPGT